MISTKLQSIKNVFVDGFNLYRQKLGVTLLIAFIWIGMGFILKTLVMAIKVLNDIVNHSHGWSQQTALTILIITLGIMVASIIAWLLSIWTKGVLYVTMYQPGAGQKKDWRQAVKYVKNARWRLLFVNTVLSFFIYFLAALLIFPLINLFMVYVGDMVQNSLSWVSSIIVLTIEISFPLVIFCILAYAIMAQIFAEISVLIDDTKFAQSVKVGLGMALKKIGYVFCIMLLPFVRLVIVISFLQPHFGHYAIMLLRQFSLLPYEGSVEALLAWFRGCSILIVQFVFMPWVMANALVLMNQVKKVSKK